MFLVQLSPAPADISAVNSRSGAEGPNDDDPALDQAERLAEAALLERVAEAVGAPPVGLLFVELQLNSPDDSHVAVDELLLARFEAVVDAADIVVGPGPNRVAVIRQAMTAPAEAEGTARRLHGVLSGPVAINRAGESVTCQAAIGVAVSLTGDSANDLVRYARHALDDARMLGGDTVVVFDDDDRDLLLP
jgi:predicted signal transduction protein with EAL and GGDEF domain